MVENKEQKIKLTDEQVSISQKNTELTLQQIDLLLQIINIAPMRGELAEAIVILKQTLIQMLRQKQHEQQFPTPT